MCDMTLTVFLHMTCELWLTCGSHLAMNRALSHTPMEMSMLENSRTARSMGRARLGMLMGMNMKANGTTTRNVGRAE